VELRKGKGALVTPFFHFSYSSRILITSIFIVQYLPDHPPNPPCSFMALLRPLHLMGELVEGLRADSPE
jgi:hypothetical protein